ncbi:hypothetical protein M758_4G242900 [Ceratodon purpureus]|nr:hypothetical protein M758_4G242900 [Ceratodon purpureus]
MAPNNRVVTGQGESTQVELTLKPATKPRKPLKVSLRMSEGDGEASYSRNSWMQGGILRDIGAELVEAVSHLTSLPTDGSPVRVADFGCSSGANTLAWADLAAKSVQHNIRLRNSKAGVASSDPEVQHFFSDLPSNDWNTLFKTLASEQWPYFAAAVAGSFHGRLFPNEYLHIAISIWSVQYLSMIPDALLDESSPAYNRDRVWIDGGHPGAAQAYAAQAREDLFSFFTHRAYELAPGGLLFLMCMCRADHARPERQTCGEFINANVCGILFEEAWQECIDQVKVT